MNLSDVLSLFGSREEMAKHCGTTVNATYGWKKDDGGNLLSPDVRRRIRDALLMKSAKARRAAGEPLDPTEIALLSPEIEEQ